MDKGNIGRKFERKKKSSGKLTVGSGNKWFDKGDLKKKNFLVELKATEHDSFSVKKSIINKIKNEANQKAKHWAIVVEIAGMEVMVVESSWLEVLDEYD